VKTIRYDQPLPEAARMLLREQITGAPVVDSAGHCVGVLSATDFVRWVDSESQMIHSRKRPPFCSDWQMVDLQSLPREEVRCHMSTDVVTATPTASVPRLARQMLDAHIHRIIVVDGQHRPIGIVSSTDILAAVAYSATEDAD